jgi:hypothetical protein
VDASLLDGAMALGRNPYTPMSCEGTGGHVRRTAVTDLEMATMNQMQAGSVANRVFGRQDAPRGGASGWTESSLSALDLGGGQLRVSGILSRARVVRSSTNHYYPTAVQRVGGIVANGTTYSAPKPGKALTIPGLARIEVPTPVRTARGITVVGLRITLLGGTAADTVVNVATAKLELRAY